MSNDVRIDVHEVMEHLRGVGDGAAFVLHSNGTGYLDLGDSTMAWSNFPHFVHQFRKLKCKTAEQRVLEAATALCNWHGDDSFGKRRELDSAVKALESLGADHD